jgi:peptidoglycan/LPS O-acetylase OafA/YrhL
VLALDGIRAIAVVAVIVFHAGIRGASGGYLGVSLFFTLSGFLMGMLLLREREHTGGVDVVRFWERRLRRLLPAAIASLVAVGVLSAHDGFRAGRNGLREELVSALAYVANWRLLSEGRSYASLFASPSPVQHFWSLSRARNRRPPRRARAARLRTQERRSRSTRAAPCRDALRQAMTKSSRSGAFVQPQ